MRALNGRLRIQDTIVGNDTDLDAIEMRETRHQGRAVFFLEFLKPGAVNQSGDNVKNVRKPPEIGAYNAAQLGL